MRAHIRSSISFMCANRRMSVAILCAEDPSPASADTTSTSTFREYVCPVTRNALENQHAIQSLRNTAPFKACKLRDELIELLDFAMIASKQGEKARLSACCPLHAAEPKVLSRARQIAKIHQQVLDPQTRAFSHSGQLRRLQMRKS